MSEVAPSPIAPAEPTFAGGAFENPGEISTGLRRGLAAALAAGCGAVLGVAWWLDPDPAGVGTHTQLHIPRCGWIDTIGIPCPTCGMTTAFAHAADGHLLRSFMTQPAGAVVALATAATLLASLWVAVSGASVTPFLRVFAGSRCWWLGGALLLGGWAWKIARFKGWM